MLRGSAYRVVSVTGCFRYGDKVSGCGGVCGMPIARLVMRRSPGRRHGLPAAISVLAAAAVGGLTNVATSGWSWPVGAGLLVLTAGWASWEWQQAVRTNADRTHEAGSGEDGQPLLGAADQLQLDRPLVRLPRPVRRLFVGRDDVLAALDVAADGSTVVCQTVAGLGGVGKTELVLHYCHQHRDRFPVLWWVTADSREAVRTGLAELTATVAAATNRVGPKNVADAAAWAMAWLSAQSGWLLVLDNVEDRADVEDLLGRLAGGQVLITSRRDAGWEDLADSCLRLDPLDVDAAVAVLTARGGPRDPTVARQLATELGYLPLALTQAAAYLGQTRVPMAGYLQQLRDRPQAVLDVAAPGDDTQRTVARVWDVTLGAVGTVDQFAIEVLRVLACLAPDNVPRGLLAGLDTDKDKVDGALGLLASYSMLTLTEADVSTHRLVQAVVVDQTTAAGVLSDTLRRALRLLAAVMPADHPGDSTADWPAWAVLAPQAQALAARWSVEDPDADLARILTNTGDYLRIQGAYAESVRLGERAVAIHETTLGPDHSDTMHSRHTLALGYWEVGRSADAVASEERALADRTRILGSDHPDTLHSRHGLALGLQAMGRYAQSNVLEEQTVADRIRVLGADHPDTLRSQTSLAVGYWSVGRNAEAVSVWERTLADRIRVLGPEHPDTLQSRGNLALGYAAMGRYAEAIALNEQTLADRIRVLGPDHPATLASRNNLAGNYQDAGRHAEAITMLEQTLADHTRVLGPDHPHTLGSRGNLADGYRTVGRHAEAITMLEQTLADMTRVLGNDHPYTLSSRYELASAYQAVGQHAEAITMLEQTLADMTRVLGPDHPDTVQSRDDLAAAYEARNEQSEGDGVLKGGGLA